MPSPFGRHWQRSHTSSGRMSEGRWPMPLNWGGREPSPAPSDWSVDNPRYLNF